jgi:hypothetical protein
MATAQFPEADNAEECRRIFSCCQIYSGSPTNLVDFNHIKSPLYPLRPKYFDKAAKPRPSRPTAIDVGSEEGRYYVGKEVYLRLLGWIIGNERQKS